MSSKSSLKITTRSCKLLKLLRCQALAQADVTLEDLDRVRASFKEKSFMGKQQFKYALLNQMPPYFWEVVEPIVSETQETVKISKFTQFLDDLMGQASTMKLLGNTSKKMRGLLSPREATPISANFQDRKIFSYLQFRIEEKYKSLAIAFRAFDKDYDGLLNLLQFKEGLRDLGMRLEEQDIRRIFFLLEQKHSKGGLDLAQFCSIEGLPLLKSGPQSARFQKKKSPSNHGLIKSRDPNTFNTDVQSQGSSLSKMWRNKMGYRLPSHLDEGYRYGSPNVVDHNMTALMTNQFERNYVPAQKPSQTKMRKLREIVNRSLKLPKRNTSQTPEKLKKFREVSLQPKPPVPSHVVHKRLKLPHIENLKLL